MMLAIAGVFFYNRAKQHDREELHTLPLSRTHTSLSDATLVAYDPQKLHDSDILYRCVNFSSILFIFFQNIPFIERSTVGPRMKAVDWVNFPMNMPTHTTNTEWTISAKKSPDEVAMFDSHNSHRNSTLLAMHLL